MSFRMRFRSMVHGAVAMAFVCAMGITGTVSAQFGEVAGLGEIMQQGFLKRDVLVMAQALELDPTQRVIIDTLFSDYERDFETAKLGIKQKYDDMRPELQAPGIDGDKNRLMRLIMQPFKQFGVEKTKLDEEFLENVKAVLSEEQLTLWPGVERRLYREKKIHKGHLAGESLDLTNVVRDMHLDEPTTEQIMPVVEAYEITLDQALHHREAARGTENNDMMDAMSEQDLSKQIAAMEKFTKLRLAVRNVNEEYIERIAMALSEDLASKFRASALERAFPRIYREHGVQRMFREALALEGLDKAVAESIHQIEAAYLAELNVANEELRKVMRETDPQDSLAKANEYSNRMQGDGAVAVRVDPTRELFIKRDETSRNYARQLHGLLRAEQFEQLTNGNRWVEKPPEPVEQTADPKPTDRNGKERTHPKANRGSDVDQ